MKHPQFRVALTADFYEKTGHLKYADVGLDQFNADQRIHVGQFATHLPEITPEQLHGLHGVLVLTPGVTASSLAQADELLAIARFGVGYDSVDVTACTAANVILCITAGAVDHSVAEATVGWMLALSHHMLVKDKLVRKSRWNDRSSYMGSELRERTLGLVGCGGIGRAVLRLLSGFRMKQPLVYDPHVPTEVIAQTGARSVSLDELLRQSDFVSLHCPLTEQTRNLIGARELSLMRPTSFLLNTARGGIVEENALFDALKERRIAGAALDCFSVEPPPTPPPFSELENVLLAPHSIAWTNELFQEIGRTGCRSLVDVALGRRPHGIVNPEVLDRPGFQEKWKRLRLTDH